MQANVLNKTTISFLSIQCSQLYYDVSFEAI